MSLERMPTRQLRVYVSLKNAGMPTREIARRVGVASKSVRLTLRRREAAGVARPLDADLTDAVLEQRPSARSGVKPVHHRHEGSDWAGVHREMKRRYVTLSILWVKYIEQHPGGYRYSWYCDLYRKC